MIRIDNLKKSYNKKDILKDITVQFETGKVYGIVGENGAGKTTLFKCIASLEKFEGSISSQPSPLKDHLGYLPTEPYFFPRITGKEYIQLLLNARGISHKNLKQKNLFDLPLNQYALEYSTGMKKKLALQAILLQKNNLFILDEPYNGVDIQSNIIISEIIQKLKEAGKTILISSHIFSTLKESCDEIYLLQDGQLKNRTKKADFDTFEKELHDSIISIKVDDFIS